MNQDGIEDTDSIDAAIEAFRNGDPVLAYDADDREGEIDIVYPPATVTARDVAQMRNDAGGLVCVAVSDHVGEVLDLPFVKDILDHEVASGEVAYDERSATSISVNHHETFTGITDEDRSLTIRALGELGAAPSVEQFVEQFRSPGHVRLLRAAPNLLADRRGHTEFGVALAAAADLPPVAVVCEMLDDETGQALSTAAARTYADRNGLVYVDMSELTNEQISQAR